MGDSQAIASPERHGVMGMFRRLAGRLPALFGYRKRVTLTFDDPVDAPEAAPVVDPVQNRFQQEAALRRRLADVFDPGHPVRTRNDLIGRDRELSELLTAALDMRQHIVLYGARGSGKTSLVRVFGDHADQRGAVALYLAAEPNSTFAEILRPYLRHVPDTALFCSRAEFNAAIDALPENFGPRGLHDLLLNVGGRPVLFIIDELDRVQSDQVRADLASFMKMLSDTRSAIQLLLVGIAQSIGELIAGHPSLRRHLVSISLGRISGASVANLIAYGERSTQLRFDRPARELIARAACGSPYHVRLFCQHAGLAAIRLSADSMPTVIMAEAVLDGFASALRQWSQTNDQDSPLFAALAQDRSLARSLEAIARRAAVQDGISLNDDVISESDQRALASLSDSLAVDGAIIGKMLFKDTVSPQFLITALILAESEAGDEQRIAVGDKL